ncbi:hypothetical protein M426DRAFT_21992 [Hypoxylon sp. CI-4A]|nr:hypothetical protein M426DRAFT_21992 [Hypoxylon sp. CI-4A]
MSVSDLDIYDFYFTVCEIIGSDKYIQHSRIGSGLGTLPLEQHPRDTKYLIKSSSGQENKDQLGKNLLDSFALIFAQSNAGSVIATAMKLKEEEKNTYTLLIARSDGECSSRDSNMTASGHVLQKSDSCTKLAKQMREWFENKDEITGHHGKNHINRPSLQNSFWTAILENCGDKIRKLIVEKCKPPDGINDVFSYIRRAIGDINTSLPIYSREALDCLSSIVDGLEICYRSEKPPLTTLDKVTSLCFQLVSLHRPQMEAMFERLATGNERWWWNRFEWLLFMIANYRRAWYDMVRLKIDDNSAILHVEFLGSKSGKIHKGMIKNNDKDTFLNEYQIASNRLHRHSSTASRSDEEAWGNLWVHCEIQMLNHLLTNEQPDDFYGYIGCSKGPCWLCEHTLKNLTSSFTMRKSHMKIYPSWDLPRFREFKSVRPRVMKILKFLHAEMKLRIQEGKVRRTVGSDCPDVMLTFRSPLTDEMRWLEYENFEGDDS